MSTAAYRQANKEKIAAYAKAHREANREKISAYRKAHREANREKVLAQERAYYRANREKHAATMKAYYKANRWRRSEYVAANPEQRRNVNQRYAAANPEKLAAQRAVSKAIRHGELERGVCEVCNTPDNVEGHHDNYEKQLDVRWLCKTHHTEHHCKQREQQRQ